MRNTVVSASPAPPVRRVAPPALPARSLASRRRVGPVYVVLPPPPAGVPEAGAAPELPAEAEHVLARRAPGLDVLRVVAVLAIVWFHCGAPGGRWLCWHLPALVMISTALMAGRASTSTFPALARRRAGRLLVPWLFWCAVYAAWALAVAVRRGSDLSGVFNPWMLLGGTDAHLWYLPFAFLAALAVGVVQRCLPTVARPTDQHSGIRSAAVPAGATLLAGALLALVACLPDGWFHHRTGLPAPLPQYLFCLPAVPLGFVIGTAAACGQGPGSLRLTLLGVSLFVAAVCLALDRAGTGRLSFDYAAAGLLVWVALMVVRSVPARLARVADLAFPTYLVHLLIHHLVLRTHLVERGTYGFAAGVTVLSVAAAWVMVRVPFLRRFAGVG